MRVFFTFTGFCGIWAGLVAIAAALAWGLWLGAWWLFSNVPPLHLALSAFAALVLALALASTGEVLRKQRLEKETMEKMADDLQRTKH